MGLLNSIFGQRKKYNEAVDKIIRNNLMIETNSSINPRAPRMFVYLQEIDIGWHNKYNPYECAIMFGVDYLSGGIRQNDIATLTLIKGELNDVERNIRTLINDCNNRKLIKEELAQGFSKYVTGLRDEMRCKISG